MTSFQIFILCGIAFNFFVCIATGNLMASIGWFAAGAFAGQLYKNLADQSSEEEPKNDDVKP